MLKRCAFRMALSILPLFMAAGTLAQQAAAVKSAAPTAESGGARAGAAAVGGGSALDLARAAVAAQGGERFLHRQSIVLSGTADFFVPNATMAAPGKFIIAAQGNRLYRELRVTNFAIRQIYDGQREYVSMRGIHFPPPDKFGMDALAKFDQPGYTVTALPDKKKLHAFRITDAEGHATDFYTDPETGRVLRYEFKYEGLMTGMEMDRKSLKEVDGVLVAYSFTERLGTEQGTFYVDYKVKDVKINQPIDDASFAIPNR
jgi:hypothetical protein